MPRKNQGKKAASQKEFTEEQKNNLALWSTAGQAALQLDTTPKYINTMATKYGWIGSQVINNRRFYWKEDLDQIKVIHGQPGPRKPEGPPPEKRKPGRPRKQEVQKDAA